MKKFSVVFLLCFSFMLSFAYAGDIVLNDSHRGGVELKWTLESYRIFESGDYSFVEFPGGCGLYGVGKPSVPSQQAFIEIPMDAQPVLRINDPVMEVVKIGKPLAPAQEPTTDTIGGDNLTRGFVMDRSTYESDSLFPGKVVEIAYQGVMRGRKLVLVKINPVQYNPKSGKVVIYKNLTVYVDFVGGARSLGDTDNAMDTIAGALVKNFQPARGKTTGSVDYLIITVQELKAKAEVIAQWKNEKGLKTQIEVVDHNPTVAQVRDVIKKYYPGVKYVLILADHPQIPLYSSAARHPMGAQRLRTLGIEDGSVPSDTFYACVDGDDYYPDVYIGRIPANNEAEADLMINKIISNQKNPPAGDWIKRFLLCGEFQYQYSQTNMAERLFCETAFTIWNSLHTKYVMPAQTVGTGSSGLGHDEYFFRKAADPSNELKPGTYRSKIRDAAGPVVECKMPAEWAKNIVSDSEAKQNVLAFWRGGAFLVQHRDHGGQTSWGKPSLSKTDMQQLDNGNKLPILFSINCLTGYMDYSSDCFVEAALKNANGGAVAAIGSTRVSYSWWNDRLCDGFYTCLFGTDVYDCMDTGVKLPTGHPFSNKLGIVLNFGKMYLALNYPSNPWGTSYDYTETEFYLFHCIGDPEMQIWTAAPQKVTAGVNRGQISLNSKGKINDVTVCLYGEGKQILLQADAQGNYSIPQGLTGTYKLTVSGTNLYPYQTTINLK